MIGHENRWPLNWEWRRFPGLDRLACGGIDKWQVRGCTERSQPMSSGAGNKADKKTPSNLGAPQIVERIVEKIVERPMRRKLPDERTAMTHKFSIAGHEGYITAGLFEDGTPGEIFITMSKEGSTISGLMDNFATAISFCLQYGVPLKFLVDKFSDVRFEPSGWTGNPQIPYAKSIMDYIFRWLVRSSWDLNVQLPRLAQQRR